MLTHFKTKKLIVKPKMIMNNKRNYKGTAVYMAESARTVYNLLLEDLPKFTAYNTRFTVEYANEFLNQINAADTIITDVTILAKQGVETQKVLTAMQQASQLYNRIKNHAQWAFEKTSPAIVKEFTSGYNKIGRNQPKMLLFLETLEKVINTHIKELIDVNKGGMPRVLLSELIVIKEQLKTANVQQEVYKKKRLVITETRVNTLNNCYATMVQINNLAQLVFNDQPAKRSQYSYRWSSGNNKLSDFVGNVAPNETKVITSLPFMAGTYISFENRGVVPLQFDLSMNETTLEGNMVELEGGAINNQAMEWLLAEGVNGTNVNVLVHNPSENETASYLVSTDIA